MFERENDFGGMRNNHLCLNNTREQREKTLQRYKHSGIDALNMIKTETKGIQTEFEEEKTEVDSLECFKFNFDAIAEEELLGKRGQKVTEADLYEDNGGTTIALSIGNKLIIAGDTRLNGEYDIYTRNKSKIYKVGNFYLTISGFDADGYKVFLTLLYFIKKYEKYGEMKLSSAARLLHHILYGRRFFPLYSYCTLSGYEEKEAIVYSFDCVGSYEKTPCRVNGSGTKMIQPLLDSWIKGNNFENYKQLEFEHAVNLVKKAFDSAAESDIKTGDYLEMLVIDGEEERREIVELRKD